LGRQWIGRICNRDFNAWCDLSVVWLAEKSLYAKVIRKLKRLGLARWVRPIC